MTHFEMKIEYKQELCKGYFCYHIIITDYTNVDPLINLLIKNGCEIVDVQERKIDTDLWDYLDGKWKKASDLFEYYKVLHKEIRKIHRRK